MGTQFAFPVHSPGCACVQVSLATQEKADERMSQLLQESYSATRALLARNKPLLDRLTQRLLSSSSSSETASGNGVPAASNGAAVWRSDGSVGTVHGAEVRALPARADLEAEPQGEIIPAEAGG